MELSVKTLIPGVSPKVTSLRQMLDVYTTRPSSRGACFSIQTKYKAQKYRRSWQSRKYIFAACAVLEGAKDVEVSSSPSGDFWFTTTKTNESNELKIDVEISGAKTREIFNHVFDKMVAAAQPIPGYKREKGGKTPNVPRDNLLEFLGPVKVYTEVIKKAINTAIAEYVRQEGLKVTKNLRVEQSFEDLYDAYDPDFVFNFTAVIQLQEQETN